MKSGETVTGIFTELQIIDPDTFDAAQRLFQQRSVKAEERHVPLNTRGSSLLSSNVFCGHCGARLTVTTNGKKYHRKDGEVSVTPRTRYVCYNKTSHKHLCERKGVCVQAPDRGITKPGCNNSKRRFAQ